MTADELNRLLARAGTETTMQAARLFRRDKSAFSLLTRGEPAISSEVEGAGALAHHRQNHNAAIEHPGRIGRIIISSFLNAVKSTVDE
jgi:hypothetical protein